MKKDRQKKDVVFRKFDETDIQYKVYVPRYNGKNHTGFQYIWETEKLSKI